MIRKKINAVIAILISLMLIDHSIACSIHLITHNYEDSIAAPAIILTCLVVIHASISIFAVFVKHDNRTVKYKKLNRGTMVQRITGIAVILVLIPHAICAWMFMPERVTQLFIVTHFIFVIVADIHAAISVPKGLVTLGLLASEKKYKICQIICWIICIPLIALGLAGSIFGG